MLIDLWREVGNATLDVSTHTDGRMRELLLEIQALKAQQLNGSNCETGMNGRAAVQGPDSTERHNAEKSLEPVLPSIELSESVSVTEAHGQVQTGEPSKQDAFEPYDRDSGLGPFARRKANNYPGLASFGTENLPTKHSECPTSEWRWKAEKSEGGSRINIVTAQTNFLNSIETHSGIGAWLSTFRESWWLFLTDLEIIPRCRTAVGHKGRDISTSELFEGILKLQRRIWSRRTTGISPA